MCVPSLLSSQLTANELRESNWALAEIYAYRTYQNHTRLETANTIWNKMAQYFVTPENAASGTHPTRNVSFSPSCGGGTGSLFIEYVSELSLRCIANAGAVFVGTMELMNRLETHAPDQATDDPRSTEVNGATVWYVLASSIFSHTTQPYQRIHAVCVFTTCACSSVSYLP